MRGMIGSRIGVFAALFCLLHPCLPAFAESDAIRRSLSKSGKANHEISLSGHARTDKNCGAMGTTPIDLDQAPAHGVVCLRPAQVTLEYLAPGTPERCRGQKPLGLRVIYLPRHDYVGSDAVRYTVRFKTATVKIDVSLTVLPDAPPSTAVMPTDISSPVEETLQELGPIPLCAALVS
jgi:hypothetical protein